MNSTYTFDTKDAENYGVDEAIMLKNFKYWIAKNKANDKHKYETEIDDKTVSRYWTYNSVKAFSKLFPFWSARQIDRILNSLIEQKIIVKDNFNQTKYDRTCWYALRKGFTQTVNPISPNGKMEFTKQGNRNTETVKPIPDNKPNNKPTTKIEADNLIKTLENIGVNDDIINKAMANHTKSQINERLNIAKYKNNVRSEAGYFVYLLGVADDELPEIEGVEDF